MANKHDKEKTKMTATRIICCILAGLMVLGSIAIIISAFIPH